MKVLNIALAVAPESSWSLPSNVVVPVTVAVCAGLVSWFISRANLKSQKKQRQLVVQVELAKFRQAWIDDLRSDMAQFSALSFVRGDNPLSEEKYLAWLECMERISLRINPKDKDAKDLSTAMTYDIDRVVKGFQSERRGRSFSTISQSVLKREWDRLQKDLLAVDSETVSK